MSRGDPWRTGKKYQGSDEQRKERTIASARFAKCEEAYVRSHYTHTDYPQLKLARDEAKKAFKLLLAQQGLTQQQIRNEILRLEYLGWTDRIIGKVKVVEPEPEPEPEPKSRSIRDMTEKVLELKGPSKKEAEEELYQLLLLKGSTPVQATKYLASIS